MVKYLNELLDERVIVHLANGGQAGGVFVNYDALGVVIRETTRTVLVPWTAILTLS